MAGRWVAAVPTWPTIFVAATSLIRIGLDTAGQPSTGAAGAGAGGGNLAAGLGWAGLGCLAQGYRCAPSSRAAAQPHNHQKVKESTLVKKQLAGRGGAGGEALVCTGEAAVVLASSKQPLQAPTSARRLPAPSSAL